jgi:MoxR-like ATPase
MNRTIDQTSAPWQSLHAAYAAIRAELEHVIVGQQSVIDELLIAMLAGGHCLLVGVPGSSSPPT